GRRPCPFPSSVSSPPRDAAPCFSPPPCLPTAVVVELASTLGRTELLRSTTCSTGLEGLSAGRPATDPRPQRGTLLCEAASGVWRRILKPQGCLREPLAHGVTSSFRLASLRTVASRVRSSTGYPSSSSRC